MSKTDARSKFLQILRDHPRGLTSSEVGSLLQIDAKTAGSNLSKMYAYGYVKRQKTKQPNGQMIYLSPENSQ